MSTNEEPRTDDISAGDPDSEAEVLEVDDMKSEDEQAQSEDTQAADDAQNDSREPELEPESEEESEEELESKPTPAEIIADLEAALAAAESRADSQLDKLQRTAAEFQNSKRRQEKQLADAIERADTNIIQKLLPVLDDLDLAFQNLPDGLDQESEAWLGGFEQIRKKLFSILDDQGVTVIDDTGVFDPTRHEAVSSEPNEDVESGHLIAILRTGYERKGRVLRPALVRVAM